MPITRIKTMVWQKRFLGLFFVMLTGALGAFFFAPVEAGQRVVTIHDGAATKTVTTDAATIGDVLSRAKVAIGEADLVEPAAETPLLSPTYTVNIYRARPVTIIDGNLRKRVMTPYQSGRSIVKHADLVLHDEDEVETERIENFVTDGAFGLKVSVDRAVALTLVLYGTPTPVRTQATTVEELLQEKQIKLAPEDGLSLAKAAPIAEGIIVDVWRKGAETKTEEQPVAFEVEKIQNADREAGYREVKEPGQPGKKMVTYQIDLKNGKEVARKEIQSVVVQQPKKQVEIVGAKAGFGGSFGEALARLRSCEAGGNYARNSGNGYYGAYQFSASSWRSWAPAAYKNVMAHEAPAAAQDEAVWNYYRKSGWRPWPACSQKLGLQDIYR